MHTTEAGHIHPAGRQFAPSALPGSRTRILLVDDHELIRCGAKAMYSELLGVPLDWLEASSLREALDIYASEPDIDAVLLDLNLSDCKGLQGLRQFVNEFPRARIAVFSATQDEFVIRQAEALGAVGYVPKGAPTAQMLETLRALLWPGRESLRRGSAGTKALFPRLAGSAMYDRVAQLGPRHLEILELVLSGCNNQEISNALRLSLGTVKNYVSSLLLALDVKSRAHLVSLFR
ncbi:MAG: response regulator transcription factor [Pseudomonadota bacterium]|nr:response regulator transcription factor [Pseudomonadota bacterium]